MFGRFLFSVDDLKGLEHPVNGAATIPRPIAFRKTRREQQHLFSISLVLSCNITRLTSCASDRGDFKILLGIMHLFRLMNDKNLHFDPLKHGFSGRRLLCYGL